MTNEKLGTERLYYTVPELVARLNSSRHVIQELLRRGALKGQKASGKWNVDVKSAERLFKNAKYIPPVASRLLLNPSRYNLGAVSAYLANLAESADGYEGEEPVVAKLQEVLGLSGEEAWFLVAKGRAVWKRVRRTLSRLDRSWSEQSCRERK